MPTEVIPISLGGAHAFLLKGQRSILVDTGTPGNAEIILRVLKARGVAPRDVSLILITHGHSDHFGSAFALRQATGAPVMIHQADAEALRIGRNPILSSDSWLGKLAARIIPRQIKNYVPFEPDILIESETSLAPYGVEGIIIPTPGHTAGSVSALLENGDAFVGDLLSGRILRKSRASLPVFAEDRQILIESLRGLLARHPQLLFCGHGGPFTPQQILQSIPGVAR